MVTLILCALFGIIGGSIGEFMFEQHCIIGTLLGILIGLIIRFGSGEGMEGLADAFDGFGGGDGGFSGGSD